MQNDLAVADRVGVNTIDLNGHPCNCRHIIGNGDLRIAGIGGDLPVLRIHNRAGQFDITAVWIYSFGDQNITHPIIDHGEIIIRDQLAIGIFGACCQLDVGKVVTTFLSPNNLAILVGIQLKRIRVLTRLDQPVYINKLCFNNDALC